MATDYRKLLDTIGPVIAKHGTHAEMAAALELWEALVNGKVTVGKREPLTGEALHRAQENHLWNLMFKLAGNNTLDTVRYRDVQMRVYNAAYFKATEPIKAALARMVAMGSIRLANYAEEQTGCIAYKLLKSPKLIYEAGHSKKHNMAL